MQSSQGWEESYSLNFSCQASYYKISVHLNLCAWDHCVNGHCIIKNMHKDLFEPLCMYKCCINVCCVIQVPIIALMTPISCMNSNEWFNSCVIAVEGRNAVLFNEPKYKKFG